MIRFLPLHLSSFILHSSLFSLYTSYCHRHQQSRRRYAQQYRCSGGMGGGRRRGMPERRMHGVGLGHG